MSPCCSLILTRLHRLTVCFSPAPTVRMLPGIRQFVTAVSFRFTSHFFHAVEKLQGMIHRLATARLTQLLGRFPAVALLGPRQVGKMTLALRLTNLAQNSPLYLDLELPSDRAKLADPELYLSG